MAGIAQESKDSVFIAHNSTVHKHTEEWMTDVFLWSLVQVLFCHLHTSKEMPLKTIYTTVQHPWQHNWICNF